MKPHVLRKLIVSTAMIATMAILAGVYVANGSELENAWLYLSSAGVVIAVMIPELFKKDNEQ